MAGSNRLRYDFSPDSSGCGEDRDFSCSAGLISSPHATEDGAQVRFGHLSFRKPQVTGYKGWSG